MTRYIYAFTFNVVMIFSHGISANAQISDTLLPRDKGIEVGFGIGLYTYQGDLTPDNFGSLKTIKPGTSIWIQKPLANRFAIKLNMVAATLLGDDAQYGAVQEYRSKRNFSFVAPVKEISLSGILDLGKPRGANVKPFLSAGIGCSFVKVKPNWTNTNFSFFNSENLRSRLLEDSVQGTPKSFLVIPLGAGIKMKITENIFLTIDGLYRFSLTDYLDGFSVAANSKKNDYYYSFNTSIGYKFNNSNNKDKVINNTIPLPVLNSGTGNSVTNNVDTDGDGIYDANDSCPYVYGYAKYNGCAAGDKDLDGVTDEFDKCPDVKGEIENYGCPSKISKKADHNSNDLETEALSKSNELAIDSLLFVIYFEWSKSDLHSEGFGVLNQVINLMKKDKSLKILLRGHTDNVGSVLANYTLSQRRTDICAAYLQSYLINPVRITQEAYGKLKPVADLTDPLLQWRNRRVEVIIYH